MSLRTISSCHDERAEQSNTLGDSRRAEQGLRVAEHVLQREKREPWRRPKDSIFRGSMNIVHGYFEGA